MHFKTIIQSCFAVVLLMALGLDAFADTPTIHPSENTTKFYPPDSHLGFGNGVTVVGDTAVINVHYQWTPYYTEFKSNALIHERDSGGTDNWGRTKTIGGYVRHDQSFGKVAAISADENTIFIGESIWEQFAGSRQRKGRVRVFERNYPSAGAWGEKVALSGSDTVAHDEFGSAISLDGTTLAIGARVADGEGNGYGQVYIFYLVSGSWVEQKILVGDQGSGGYIGFGDNSLALDGDILAVSAIFDDDEDTDSGAVFIFERNLGGTDNWGQRAKITLGASGEESGRFGRALDLDSETLIVSSYHDVIPYTSFEGEAYIYSQNQGGANNWGLVKKLQDTDSGVDHFGLSVAISGDNAFVSASWEDSGAGRVYRYGRDVGGTDNWGLEKSLGQCDAGDEGDYFGKAMAVSGDTLMIGSPGDEDAGTDAGAVYVADDSEFECSIESCLTNLLLPATYDIGETLTLEAQSEIRNVAGYEIVSGADVSMIAGQTVVLASGFSVDSGAVFSASIDSDVCTGS